MYLGMFGCYRVASYVTVTEFAYHRAMCILWCSGESEGDDNTESESEGDDNAETDSDNDRSQGGLQSIYTWLSSPVILTKLSSLSSNGP